MQSSPCFSATVVNEFLQTVKTEHISKIENGPDIRGDTGENILVFIQ